ncbi:MAG TPA: restriction endonuclease subunit S [Pseudolysinimonas sp.]|nr:restriction endonuclease subunit S [Pseudolysinimonas sp.]
MSRLDELIRELCRDGVPFRPLGELGTWYGGGTPPKSNTEFWREGTIPWLSPKDMTGEIVTSTEDRIAEAAVKKGPIRIVPPGAVAIVVRSNILRRRLPTAFVPISVTLNQDMRAVVPHDGVDVRYLSHVLHARAANILEVAGRMAGSMAAIESGRLAAYRVPVPPVEVQREIVRVLDLFQSLEAELEAELEARTLQYAHYRDSLLAFSQRTDVRYVPMAEVGEFIRGRRFTRADFAAKGIPSIHYGEIYTHYGVSAVSTRSFVRDALRGQLRFAEPRDVVIAAVGETVEDVAKPVAWLGSGPVAIHDDSYAFRSGLDPTYVSHVMRSRTFQAQKSQFVARAKVKRISGDGLGRIVIPVPPMDDQLRVAGILDKVDALVNDLSIGLPAELAARRQQYEHYRDGLLNFDELSTT